MKKSLFYSLVTTVTFLSPVFASPVRAQDCPEIPQDIKVITVNNDDATLRVQADKDSDKGFAILANDRLKVLDHKSVVGQPDQDFCWYKVSAVNDTSNKPYFIANVGIKEFPFAHSFTGDNANNTNAKKTKPSPPSSPPSDIKKQGQSGQNNVTQKELSELKWLVFVIILISIGNIIILLLVGVWGFKVLKHLNISGISRPSKKPYEKGTAPIDIQIKDSVAEALSKLEITRTPIRLSRIQHDLGLPKQDGLPSTDEKLTNQERLLQNIVTQLTNILDVLKRVEQTNQNDIKFVNIRLESLEEKRKEFSSLLNQENLLTPRSGSNEMSQGDNNLEEAESHVTESLSSSEEESSEEESSSSSKNDKNSSKITLKEIIDNFNHQRLELFNDFEATPLVLTQDSIKGHVDIYNRRILQLEIPVSPSEANYLKFDLDQTAWLIPNIKSPYFTAIMRSLNENPDENPEVFTITSGSSSGSLQLVKPAKLKEISEGQGQEQRLWGIEEPGKFIK